MHHTPFIDIHESHYLRFARLYVFVIIRMLTNHTLVLTTPSWNIPLLDTSYQIKIRLSTCISLSSMPLPDTSFSSLCVFFHLHTYFTMILKSFSKAVLYKFFWFLLRSKCLCDACFSENYAFLSLCVWYNLYKITIAFFTRRSL